MEYEFFISAVNTFEAGKYEMTLKAHLTPEEIARLFFAANGNDSIHFKLINTKKENMQIDKSNVPISPAPVVPAQVVP